MSTDKTLPEDIREKIKEKVINDDLFSSGASIAYQYAAFGYHISDSEVEELKAEIIKNAEMADHYNKKANEQAATIKELLDENDALRKIISKYELI